MAQIAVNAPTRPTGAWLPWSLVALSFVPFVAGLVRLGGLASGAPVTPENERFVQHPIPAFLHIIAALTFSVLGAFQFWGAFRARNPRWHRLAGRVVLPLGMVSALTGLWMTVSYAIPPSLQGPLLYWVRVAVSSVMFVFLVLGWRSVLRRDFKQHSRWMIRAYALGQGAGTQVVVFLPLAAIFGMPLGFPRDVLMLFTWSINVVLAEWIIRR